MPWNLNAIKHSKLWSCISKVGYDPQLWFRLRQPSINALRIVIQQHKGQQIGLDKHLELVCHGLNIFRLCLYSHHKFLFLAISKACTAWLRLVRLFFVRLEREKHHKTYKIKRVTCRGIQPQANDEYSPYFHKIYKLILSFHSIYIFWINLRFLRPPPFWVQCIYASYFTYWMSLVAWKVIA